MFQSNVFAPQLKEALAKVPSSHVGEPLLKKPLGPVHWVSSEFDFIF